MEIENLTLKQLREINALMSGQAIAAPVPATDHPYKVGKNYFIRTATYHFTGKLIAVFPSELVLTDVAWVVDSGRFQQAITDGTLSEVEPYPSGREVILGRGMLGDATIIEWALPRVQK